jgi:steroid delta-isomerase-like uncharacterized protein
MSMTTANFDALAIILRGYEEGWNRGDMSVLDEILAPDFRGHDPSAGAGTTGRTDVAALLTQIRSAFPDVRREALDHVAAGDKIAVRWRVTGTHRGTFAGLPATGRPIDVSGITIYRLENGKIAEEWVQMDTVGLNRQLTNPGAAVAPTP